MLWTPAPLRTNYVVNRQKNDYIEYKNKTLISFLVGIFALLKIYILGYKSNNGVTPTTIFNMTTTYPSSITTSNMITTASSSITIS